jgi:GDP-L-fucose synthase
MNKDSRILVAGARGLVGAAVCRALAAQGYSAVLAPPRSALDLRDRAAVDRFFSAERPEYVFMAAAKVGGIAANDTYPADFIRDNLEIQTNAIDAAYRNGTRKLCFLGSSCIYPRLAPQPIAESSLLTGPLEPTNQWYAIAKIAGIKMCQAYARQYGFNAISVMPTNLYGPGDNFDLQTSHVLPALLRKLHAARENGDAEVTVWGSGTPRREFLYVDDLADALVFLMERYDSPEIINVGCGVDVTIAELARLIADIVGFRGALAFDRSKPDGTPRKLLDVGKLRALGWHATTPLAAGIRTTYDWYLANVAHGRQSELASGFKTH